MKHKRHFYTPTWRKVLALLQRNTMQNAGSNSLWWAPRTLENVSMMLMLGKGQLSGLWADIESWYASIFSHHSPVSHFVSPFLWLRDGVSFYLGGALVSAVLRSSLFSLSFCIISRHTNTLHDAKPISQQLCWRPFSPCHWFLCFCCGRFLVCFWFAVFFPSNLIALARSFIHLHDGGLRKFNWGRTSTKSH